MVRKPLEKQMPLIPINVTWCKKCVVSNQRPRITFDENGVCAACKNRASRKIIDWQERERQLVELLNQHRDAMGSWDVVVPSSGGKDSCYVAHQLKHEYGMNPLLVTYNKHYNTELGIRNLAYLRTVFEGDKY